MKLVRSVRPDKSRIMNNKQDCALQIAVDDNDLLQQSYGGAVILVSVPSPSKQEDALSPSEKQENPGSSSRAQDPVVALNDPVKSASEDEVLNLPNVRFKPDFRHYSGYLKADDEANRFLHYWFLESRTNPVDSRLVLWLSGGPGCSSLTSLLTGLGPFKIAPDGWLDENPYGWNKNANLIFMDSPAGVGFSYARDGSLQPNDTTTALENYKAFKSFLDKFPQYKRRAVYLAGEDYASAYLYTLGELFLQDRAINFQGAAVGNGCLEGGNFTKSMFFFAYYRGLIGEGSWDDFSRYCCKRQTPSPEACSSSRVLADGSDDCQRTFSFMSEALIDQGFNLHNIQANCSRPVDRPMTEENKRKEANKYSPMCYNNTLTVDYLNRADVRRALHVPGHFDRQFNVCNGNITRQMYTRNLADPLRTLLESNIVLRFLVYNGDNDLLCNHLGDEWFVRNLGQSNLWNWSWRLNKRVVGYLKKYQGISHVTVGGAGQRVWADKPAESLQLFREFLDVSSKLFKDYNR